MSSDALFSTDEINEALVRGEDLSADQAHFAMEEILNGRMTEQQLASFITLLHEKGETVEELSSLVRTMWENSPVVDVDASGALDTCGTGGDKSNTFNISTAVSLVLAAAGIPIAKHGNRAASSKCGAADVLESLGIPVTHSAPATAELFTRTGFTFLFAPTFHPGMRFAAPVRKALGVPTTFNYLGPLANPYHAPFRLHGVSQEKILDVYIRTLKELGVERAFVFHGHGGLDEVALSGPTQGYLLRDGTITQVSIDPQELGYRRAQLSELQGGDAQDNADIIRSIFDGFPGAHRDIVSLNAAIGYDLVHDTGIAQAIEIVEEVLDSGRATKKVEEISAVACELAAQE